jgi:hypothetical protein
MCPRPEGVGESLSGARSWRSFEKLAAIHANVDDVSGLALDLKKERSAAYSAVLNCAVVPLRGVQPEGEGLAAIGALYVRGYEHGELGFHRDSRGIVPERLQTVSLALVGGEEMDHHGAVVGHHPLARGKALDRKRPQTLILP